MSPIPPLLMPEKASRELTDSIGLGELGLVEIKLTDKEEAVLSEQVNPADVLIKPTGAPYLSHPAYTRWLSRAFGRTGWALVPASKPLLSEGAVVCPYILYVHGQPAAFAMGEQDYFGVGSGAENTNKNQSYGDALESTVASALRRCCKRLGIGLELWDRGFVDEWKRHYAVNVALETGKRVWRRRQDAPFYNEKGRESQPQRTAPAAHNAAGYNPAGKEKITDPQRVRLGVIVKNSGRSVEEVRSWLERRYHFKASSDITRATYDAICSAVESSNTLPEA